MRRIIEVVTFVIALFCGLLATHAWLAARSDQRRLQSTLTAQKQLLDAADARQRARGTTLKASLDQIDELKRRTQTVEQIARSLPEYLPLPQPITLTDSDLARPATGCGSVDNMKHKTKSESTPHQNQWDYPPPRDVAPIQQGTDVPEKLIPPFVDGASANVASLPPIAPFVPTDTSKPPVQTGQIPTTDLKPLLDYVQDCRACQEKLAAATQNASDDAVKIATLSRERDAAVTASKGGSFERRLRHSRRNLFWFALGVGMAFAGDKVAVAGKNCCGQSARVCANEYYVVIRGSFSVRGVRPLC